MLYEVITQMDKFEIVYALVAPLDRPNVDTDAIIPKQFLKSIKRSGFGPNLFDEWRYLGSGEPGMDNTLREMLKAQTRHHRLVIVDFEKNRGLCHAWGVSMMLARGEFVVCVDSDTFIFPGSRNNFV